MLKLQKKPNQSNKNPLYKNKVDTIESSRSELKEKIVNCWDVVYLIIRLGIVYRLRKISSVLNVVMRISLLKNVDIFRETHIEEEC